MKAHQHKRRDEVLQGYLQPCLPMYQVPEAVTPSETGATDESPGQICWQMFASLARALRATFGDLAERREYYTTSYGKKAERLLEHLQWIVSDQLSLLERRCNQYAMHERLRRLYVECKEALVTVRGVCGLAETGRLLCDPMGTYWHFGFSLRKLQRSCEDIAARSKPSKTKDTSFSAPGVLSA